MTTVPGGDEAQTTSSSGEFGNSEFGNRLEYQEQGCCVGWNDRFWAIFFYLHVLTMVALAIILPLTNPSSQDDIEIGTPSPTWKSVNSIDFKLTGIAITLLVQCIIGAVFGLIWLKVMQKFAEFIIKGMLFLVLILWLIVAIIGFIIGTDSGGLSLIIVGILMFIINGLYTWCVWSRIPFSSALLSIASSITQTFEGTICISLLMIPFNLVWYYVWSFTVYGYINNIAIPTLSNGGSTGILYLIYFLLALSLYWALQVIKNISHTTTCGVSATWYFSKEVHKPTFPALKRTLTTSFGSVCFGSFIVALLQATRALLRTQRRTILSCIVYCLLLCIERLIRYFNMYAYAQVAIYGSDFVTAAKATWGLFASKGFEAIINDDLTGLALFCGGVLAFVIAFFCGWFLIPLFYPYKDYNNIDELVFNSIISICKIIVSVIGGCLGYYLCVTILMVVRSSIICLFVCFAEDPSALQNNRPEQFNQLTSAKQELQTFAQTGHTGLGNEQEQQQQQQQQG